MFHFFLCIIQETNVFPILSELFQENTKFQSLPMVFLNIKILCLFSSLWSSLQCSHFLLVFNDHKFAAAPGSGWASKCSATILLIRKSRRLRKFTFPKSRVINCGFKNRINLIVTSKRMKYPGIDLPKEGEDLYSKNYKMLMKEIKDNTNRWND